MKKIALLLFATIMCGIIQGQDSQRQRLEQHLFTLASDSLRGREAGTDDGRRAAEYIMRQWKQMGLNPLWGDNYQWPFKNATGDYTNLVAVIEGNDPILKDEYIVIGAHYDHIGVKNGKIHNGADDNASGSSCAIEVARQLLAHQKELKRSVIICAFDAEEKGLFGSKNFVNRHNDIINKVKLMMSVDMVGWYKANGELVLEGTGTLKAKKELLSPEALGVNIKVRFKPFENSLMTATDTEPFAIAGIPTLAVTTGLKSPYHKPQDDADLIDYEGLDLVTNYIVAVTIAASRHEGELASGRLAPKHHTKSFEAGLAAGFNTTNLKFPDATFDGKTYYGMQGGLMLQYNFNKTFALRTGALYEYSHSPLPASNDAYGEGFAIEQQSILVPITLQLGIHETGMYAFLGLGLYYGYAFKGQFYGNVPATTAPYEYCCDPNQMGWTFNFGMRLGGHWQLDGTWFNPFNDLFDTAAGMPRTRKSTYAVTLGYWF